MKIKFLAIIFAMFMSLPVFSAEGIWTQGSINCGDWLNARKTNKADYLEHYLVGLVNGLALGRSVEIWHANGVNVTQDQFFYWMDAYCQKEPLSTPITGAGVFANERTNSLFEKRAAKK